MLPWESKDPSIRKFYDNDNPENKMLDEIILREFELIEKQFESKPKLCHLRNKVSKTATYFSDYYNFMSELAKKLKSRIRISSK
jgi:hypothetical protein